MKDFSLNGNVCMEPLEGTSEWYYALTQPYGDLYEAQEIYEEGNGLNGTSLYLIHYPDGAVYQPQKAIQNQCPGKPVYENGKIAYPCVDFERKRIYIMIFDCENHETETAANLSLDIVKDCYNLYLHVHPLTLSRQANNGILELIWPQKIDVKTGKHESFFYRDGNLLYFSSWQEDPDYRQEVIIRDTDGRLIERMDGDIEIMPDGSLWHVY